MKRAIQNYTIALNRQETKFEVIGDHTLKIKPLPKLDQIDKVLLHISSDDKLMGIYTTKRQCYFYEKRNWTFHSNFPGYSFKLACSLSKGTCLIGIGEIQFLSQSATNWVQRKLVQQISIDYGLPISNNEMVIMNGRFVCHQNLKKFNFDTMKIEPFVKLKIPRSCPAICLYNNRLFITGGLSKDGEDIQDRIVSTSTEIISLSDLSVEQAADMNLCRAGHGMAIIRPKSGKPKMIVFGGNSGDPRVEEWNDEEKKWTFSNLTTSETLILFSYCYKSLVE